MLTHTIKATHTINEQGLVTDTVTKIEIGTALNSKLYTPYVIHHREAIKVPTPNKQTPQDTREYLSRFNPTIALSNGASSKIGYVMPFDNLLIDTSHKTSEKQDTRNTLGTAMNTMATPKVRVYNDGSIGDIYYSSSWANAITLKDRINLKDMVPTVKNTRWFRLQLLLTRHNDKQVKRQIRRDIARDKRNISKTDKVKRPSYNKRDIPLPPSKREV